MLQMEKVRFLRNFHKASSHAFISGSSFFQAFLASFRSRMIVFGPKSWTPLWATGAGQAVLVVGALSYAFFFPSTLGTFSLLELQFTS